MKNLFKLLAIIISLLGSSLIGQSHPQKSKESKIKHHILLRSSWQTINIGDIAHSPGVLALCEKYLPDVEVRLWASNLSNGVKEMIQRRFPNVQIILSSEEFIFEN